MMINSTITNSNLNENINHNFEIKTTIKKLIHLTLISQFPSLDSIIHTNPELSNIVITSLKSI